MSRDFETSQLPGSGGGDWVVQSPDRPPETDLRRTGRPMKWIAYREIYCDLVSSKTPGEHARNVRRVLERFTDRRQLAEREVADISAADVDLYISSRMRDTWRGKPIAPRTINNEINIINAAFTKAGPRDMSKSGRRNFGYTDAPPMADLLEEDDLEPVEVSDKQLADFIAATRKITTPRPEVCQPRLFADCVLLLLFSTSLRRKALLGIPRPDDDTFIGRCELKLPASLSKTRQDQRFVLDESVVHRLAELPTEPGEPLLPWKKPDGKPYSLSYFNEVLRKAQRAAGISDTDRVRPKDLRSTVATILADEFGDAVAKKRLGHSAKTNTINTNYKSRKPRDSDRLASKWLADRIMPIVDDGNDDDEPPSLRIVG